MCLFRLTIWTAVTMKDIEVNLSIGEITVPHLITTGDTGRMLGAGWLLYLFSLILNFIFYKMHPSSPEMGTWGAQEELEEWSPPVMLEKKDKEEGEFQ